MTQDKDEATRKIESIILLQIAIRDYFALLQAAIMDGKWSRNEDIIQPFFLSDSAKDIFNEYNIDSKIQKSALIKFPYAISLKHLHVSKMEIYNNACLAMIKPPLMKDNSDIGIAMPTGGFCLSSQEYGSFITIEDTWFNFEKLFEKLQESENCKYRTLPIVLISHERLFDWLAFLEQIIKSIYATMRNDFPAFIKLPQATIDKISITNYLCINLLYNKISGVPKDSLPPVSEILTHALTSYDEIMDIIRQVRFNILLNPTLGDNIALSTHIEQMADRQPDITYGLWSTIMTKSEASGRLGWGRSTLDDRIREHPDDILPISRQRYRFNCKNPAFGSLMVDNVFNESLRKCS